MAHLAGIERVISEIELHLLHLAWRKNQMETVARNHKIPERTSAWWCWLKYLADERELGGQSRSR